MKISQFCIMYTFVSFLGDVLASKVGRLLYSLALRKLKAIHGLEDINRLMHFLLQSGCLGDHRALHLSSVLYSSGFGVKRQPYKVCFLYYLLICPISASAEINRLSV